MTVVPDLGISNLASNHQHVYEIKGGRICYAECACGHKFNRGNGVVCGSRAKVLAAIGNEIERKS